MTVATIITTTHPLLMSRGILSQIDARRGDIRCLRVTHVVSDGQGGC